MISNNPNHDDDQKPSPALSIVGKFSSTSIQASVRLRSNDANRNCRRDLTAKKRQVKCMKALFNFLPKARGN